MPLSLCDSAKGKRTTIVLGELFVAGGQLCRETGRDGKTGHVPNWACSRAEKADRRDQSTSLPTPISPGGHVTVSSPKRTTSDLERGKSQLAPYQQLGERWRRAAVSPARTFRASPGSSADRHRERLPGKRERERVKSKGKLADDP